MAYLDDRKRVNVWIVAFAIPAILFLAQSFLAFDALHEMLPLISGLAMLSPLFALIQVSMIMKGTAGKTWPNLLCVVLTVAGGIMVWRGATFAL
jgi:hypothetical protein